MNRLYNLDYLRGFAAFGIMVFHFLSWEMGEFTSDTILRRIGFYGVSIFYVLSGLTLFYVYHTKMKLQRADIIQFARKRIFRIFPLLWLATIATIILSLKVPDFTKLTLNLTGLFGFVDWDSYFAVGAWSIGNELCFYLLFPVFIYLINTSKTAFWIVSGLFLCIYLFFAFYLINPSGPTLEVWRHYLNPLNQVFLFLGGIIIGMIFKEATFSNLTCFLLLAAGIGLFIFYPTSGPNVTLISGANRVVFTVSCFLICLSFYKTDFKFPDIVSKPLTLVGEASYSVYLLHPLVYTVLENINAVRIETYYNLPYPFRFVILSVVTLLLSYVVYEKFEKFFMRLGLARTYSATVADKMPADNEKTKAVAIK